MNGPPDSPIDRQPPFLVYTATPHSRAPLDLHQTLNLRSIRWARMLLRLRRFARKLIMNLVRWNIAVSADSDQALRRYLARQCGDHKSDLSRFIEEAVCARIWELSVEKVKEPTPISTRPT